MAAAEGVSRKLFGYALSSNSVRIAALLNEKGLDYDLVAVDLDNKTPEFLAISVRNILISLMKSFNQIKFAASLTRSVHLLIPLPAQPFGQIPAFQDGDDTLFGTQPKQSRHTN